MPVYTNFEKVGTGFVIVKGYYLYKVHTEFHPTFFIHYCLRTWAKLSGS
jgi:hypothetical protein